MNGRELNDHPRPRRVVESACQLFVSLLNTAEDDQIALMMIPGIALNKRSELFENALAESLQGYLAKLAEGLPVRFGHVMGHWIPRRLTTGFSGANGAARFGRAGRSLGGRSRRHRQGASFGQFRRRHALSSDDEKVVEIAFNISDQVLASKIQHSWG